MFIRDLFKPNFMFEYFRESQEIRREIESDPSLLEKISSAVASSKGDLIGEGLHNKAYRIGQAKSGLFVALRTPISEVDMSVYEGFCQVAAMRSNEYQQGIKRKVLWGEDRVIRPVRFCIGILKDHNFGIITEDVTENEKYTVEQYASREEVRRIDQDGNEDYVLIDLDNLNDPRMMDRLAQLYWRRTQSKERKRPKFFSRENCIVL
jgi:hypothetical protein